MLKIVGKSPCRCRNLAAEVEDGAVAAARGNEAIRAHDAVVGAGRIAFLAERGQ